MVSCKSSLALALRSFMVTFVGRYWLTYEFDGGTCNDQARGAIRLTFHDGIGRSAALIVSGKFHIIKFAKTELSYPASKGLEPVVDALRHFADAHDVNYGDIVTPSPPDLVPSPSDPVEKILARMADAGFTSEDMAALLAVHSVGKQRTLNPIVTGMPFDTTPGAFDTQFHLGVRTSLRGTAYPGPGRSQFEAMSSNKVEFRITSDDALARHALTACIWQSFVAMTKLANQGHQNLIDCSFVLPSPRTWNRQTEHPPGKNRSDVEQSRRLIQPSAEWRPSQTYYPTETTDKSHTILAQQREPRTQTAVIV
ncbi:heme peroxidase [Obba rivulosa]|uniref:Peroxidase n=1 Tax=Obba rivulosa TaxID=1052685 RepID=A0A8E2AY24_9APHY|nr:heme peroxidase [Obba rivulosa]